MSLDSRLLDVLSQVVIARDRRCRKCGRGDNLTCHHVLPRQYRWGRYNPDNCMAFCEGDHGLQKVNPPKFEEMVVGIIGQEKYDALMSHKNDLMFYTRPDLNDKLAELRKLLKYYTGPIWRKYQF